ncbi:MAG: YHS domain-containing (seleno)protein [Pseudomonadota bacterium]|nr:YHS domain-containing (seleno)protein [Pseudomonadota bacterium]
MTRSPRSPRPSRPAPDARSRPDAHARGGAGRPSRREALALGLSGLAALSLGLAPGAARADADPVFADWRGRAIRGYDPVAYFTEGRPVEGSSAFETEWNGATWRFASAENRARFLAEPETYAPQYGGYCAWAVSQGYTASIEPEQWSIVEGKLYLNYNADVQAKWKADVPGFIAKADANWPKALEK